MRNFEIKNNDSLAPCGRESQSGRSMIEMLGVLAIIGVLSVGGIAGYSKAMMKYRINKTIEQITLIAGNIRTFYSTQKTYAGLDSTTADGRKIIQKAKLIPDEMLEISDGTISKIMDIFGNEIKIGIADRFSDNDSRAFYMFFKKMPSEACIELGSHNWQSTENVIEIGVGNEIDGYFGTSKVGGIGHYEGCSGMDGGSELAGCLNGSDIGIPLPLDKVTTACTSNSENVGGLLLIFR